MHILVQTWFPFSVDVCLDGPPMAAHQMDGAGIGDQQLGQLDKRFIWIEDCAPAQRLLDKMVSGFRAFAEKCFIFQNSVENDILFDEAKRTLIRSRCTIKRAAF
jgi:hypothetical protein